MRPSLSFSCFLLIVALVQFIAFSSSSEQPSVLCHSDERLALMQFKESFIIDKHACSSTSSSYPKVDSWDSQGVDCCSWDGVECDQMTGVVIGLDLSSGCLYGSINSSQHSVFSGQIPSEISKLYRLSSLDLSNNQEFNPFRRLLELKEPDLNNLIQNLTNLEKLHLSYVDMASPVTCQSSVSATILKRWRCGIQAFSGELPASIENLDSMEFLGLGHCNFTGLVPSTLGNLTNLKFLDLATNYFRGSVPPTLANLTKLDYLDLGSNYFTGFIPPELTNLTQLTHLDLQHNMLQGSVPSSLPRLEKLEFFDCDANRLGGILEMDTFLELKNLQNLFLSKNDFYLVSRNNSNATGAQLVDIGLRYCHLTEFPYFLRNQHRLQLLDLSSNNIKGQIPQ
ncbi:receptor-like protein 7 [Hibiscus syriacus]|uniref:receptor-like protein 7 n=1 Tax=Hibiscus syriacus TaxID=106335 RepID=UPI001920C36A|nr:receptor-like protein 7 [Hibiscus syriacus]